MSKKKNAQIPVSREEQAQAQQLFARYQQFTVAVRSGANRQAIETALDEINKLPMGAQTALLSLLTRERTVEAADLLLALYEFAEQKEARKEARRALLRLEGARVYPEWEAPLEPLLISGVPASLDNPPRFWKGYVTDLRENGEEIDVGEVEVLLCWLQGEDYREVRVLGFLLEFWSDGVKDFFTRVESKRSFENFMAQVRTRPEHVQLKECSLAAGRKMLKQALATNARYSTRPSRDYQLHISLINRLVLEAPEGEEEDEEEFGGGFIPEEIDLDSLDPAGVVATFVENWVRGDYRVAYDLLAQESPLREGLAKQAWMEKRDDWADSYYPDAFEPSLLQERETPQTKLWLPNPFSRTTAATREIEAAWSFETEQTTLAERPPELPEPTTTYKGTGRHWFWASFTLVQEDEAWRIQTITDECAQAQALPIDELRQRIETVVDEAEKLTQTYSAEQPEPSEKEALEQLGSLFERFIRLAYYADALLKISPREQEIREEVSSVMMMLGLFERCLAYLYPMLTLFPEEQAQIRRRIGDVQLLQAERCRNAGDEERTSFYEDLAEESYEQSLALEDDFGTHLSLARLFIEQSAEDEKKRLGEAEEQLQQAIALVKTPEDETELEYGLGKVALGREQFQEALRHFHRVVELDPDDAASWSDLGTTQRALNNTEEAEACYKRAIELDPRDPDHYSSLALLYNDQDQFPKAILALEDGLIANPDSLAMHIFLILTYLSHNDIEQAELFLEKAEQLTPGNEALQEVRQRLIRQKMEKAHAEPAQRPIKLTGPKKKHKNKGR